MQHDYNIANDSGANVRADLNNVLAAIKTMNSGATAPSSTAPGMSWFDTSDSNTWYWKLRNNADDAWIFVGALDVATDVFQPMIGADELETYLTNNFYTETEVNSLLNAKVSTTGNQTIAGIKTFSSFPITPSSAPTTNYQVANKKYVDDNGFNVATTSEAQTGTDNTKAITPLRLHETMLAGVTQTWQDLTVSRSAGVTYTNTSGRPIVVNVKGLVNAGSSVTFVVDGVLSHANRSTYQQSFESIQVIVPNGSTYNYSVGGSMTEWYELR